MLDRAWFRALRARSLGPRWIVRVEVSPACGFDLRSWMMASPPPGMRRFPSAVAGPVLPVRGACDVWHADEEPGHALEAHPWQLAIGRDSAERATPAIVEIETGILRALARDPEIAVAGWSMWAARSGHQDVIAAQGRDGDSLADQLGEGGVIGAQRLPAATLSCAGVSTVLDDEQWLTWAWIQLLHGKRASPLDPLLARGGALRGEGLEELRALVALVRSRMAAQPPPVLPGAWKKIPWQESAVTRLQWMLERVWKTPRPPHLAEVLSHLDAFARRAKEEAVPLEVTVRDGLGPTRHGQR